MSGKSDTFVCQDLEVDSGPDICSICGGKDGGLGNTTAKKMYTKSTKRGRRAVSLFFIFPTMFYEELFFLCFWLALLLLPWLSTWDQFCSNCIATHWLAGLLPSWPAFCGRGRGRFICFA